MLTKLLSAACLVAALCLGAFPAAAGSSPFIGEIDTFAFGFCPSGWVPPDGSLLLIADNEALFNLLGTTYGGDGVTTFALPLVRPIFTLAPNGAQLTQCIALLGVFPSRD